MDVDAEARKKEHPGILHVMTRTETVCGFKEFGVHGPVSIFRGSGARVIRVGVGGHTFWIRCCVVRFCGGEGGGRKGTRKDDRKDGKRRNARKQSQLCSSSLSSQHNHPGCGSS